MEPFEYHGGLCSAGGQDFFTPKFLAGFFTPKVPNLITDFLEHFRNIYPYFQQLWVLCDNARKNIFVKKTVALSDNDTHHLDVSTKAPGSHATCHLTDFNETSPV